MNNEVFLFVFGVDIAARLERTLVKGGYPPIEVATNMDETLALAKELKPSSVSVAVVNVLEFKSGNTQTLKVCRAITKAAPMVSILALVNDVKELSGVDIVLDKYVEPKLLLDTLGKMFLDIQEA